MQFETRQSVLKVTNLWQKKKTNVIEVNAPKLASEYYYLKNVYSVTFVYSRTDLQFRGPKMLLGDGN